MLFEEGGLLHVYRKNTVFPNSLTNQADSMQAAWDDDVLAASSKLMQRNKHVYEELAK